MIVWEGFRFGWYIAWEKPSVVRFQKASWPCRHHHGHHVGRARATLYSMGRSVSVQLRPWIGLTLVAKRGNVSTMWREYRVLDVTDVHLICLTEMLVNNLIGRKILRCWLYFELLCAATEKSRINLWVGWHSIREFLSGKWFWLESDNPLTALEADSYCWNVEGWWGRKEQVVAISFGRCILNWQQLCKNFPFQDRELCGIAFRY